MAFGRSSLGKQQHRNEVTLVQGTAGSPVPLPAAWLPRIPWMGPTWDVGGTLATPLLVTEEGVEGFRHRFSDFSLRKMIEMVTERSMRRQRLATTQPQINQFLNEPKADKAH